MYLRSLLVLILASLVSAAPLFRVTFNLGGGVFGGGNITPSLSVGGSQTQVEGETPSLHRGGLDSDSDHESHMLPPAGAQVTLGEPPESSPSSSSSTQNFGQVIKNWACNLSDTIQKFTFKIKLNFTPSTTSKVRVVQIHRHKLMSHRRTHP